ncbi:hypothetical protein MHU86_4951 [Fragilaria crotonensis]|nr:hypothetical protein MHU86_4951 [Fragilaria crotonensis]
MMKELAISILEARNLTTADIPAFLIVHTALSAVLVSSTWLWCYQSPNPNILTRPLQKMTARLLPSSNSGSKIQTLLKEAIPSLDATKLAVSFVEAKVGRLMIKPLTVPARLWLSWRGTLAFNAIRRKTKGK